MVRRRKIVGLGEAVLLERPQGGSAAGLAATVALAAVRLGHAGIVVSRVGQDAPGDELITMLGAGGADTTCLQRDPDLPTARIIERAIGPTVVRFTDAPAAFDNLQADFDLEDVAQQADAVVYGLVARRNGQTRSEENRFLGACAAALKVFDLTNRLGDAVDRNQVQSGMEHADGVVVDEVALAAAAPGSRDLPLVRQARELMRAQSVSFVVVLSGPGGASAGSRRDATLLVGEDAHKALLPGDPIGGAVALVALLDGILAGAPMADALDAAARAGAYAIEHPGDALPASWREAHE